jgi:DNA-binding response OmpR family regulator
MEESMSHEDGSAPTVLVVDDEERAADTYASVLDAEYDARTAYGGEAALERLAATEVDVVLLDRRMPELSGDDVLAAIQRRGIDCRVAMVTAVNPDFDIVELGIDDYIVKPVGKEALRETVDRLLALEAYDERQRELSSLKIKRNVLEIEKPNAALSDSEEFARLEARIEELEAELADMAAELDVPDRR